VSILREEGDSDKQNCRKYNKAFRVEERIRNAFTSTALSKAAALVPSPSRERLGWGWVMYVKYGLLF
jgi:hypothetical protein